MKVFTNNTIDNETRNDLIATECSFNIACSFLMQKGFDNPIVTSPDLRFTRLDFGNDTVFIYDEERGYLLREVNT
jgi:hypothetical protein